MAPHAPWVGGRAKSTHVLGRYRWKSRILGRHRQVRLSGPSAALRPLNTVVSHPLLSTSNLECTTQGCDATGIYGPSAALRPLGHGLGWCPALWLLHLWCPTILWIDCGTPQDGTAQARDATMIYGPRAALGPHRVTPLVCSVCRVSRMLKSNVCATLSVICCFRVVMLQIQVKHIGYMDVRMQI